MTGLSEENASTKMGKKFLKRIVILRIDLSRQRRNKRNPAPLESE
jgi:hypothetical protein